MTKLRFTTKLPGFSLIEIAFVLIIVGILAGASFKGKELLDNARLNSDADELNKILIATNLYRETYNYWPGDDPNAQDNFGQQVKNGDGDNLLSPDEQKQFWSHLNEAGFLQSSQEPQLKLNALVFANTDPKELAQLDNDIDESSSELFLIVKQSNGDGAFTPLQAKRLTKLLPDFKTIITHGKNAKKGDCVLDNGRLNLKNKGKACIVLIKF